MTSTKILAAAFLASAMLTAPAMAQSNPPPAMTTATNPAPASATTDWRASKLIGVNVYNDQNDKLGDINDIILDKSGKVQGVVLAVGGFLGMGEHYVEVTMDKLRFSDQPAKSATTGANTSANTTTRTSSDAHKWYPDHAVLNATKDQLKAMPQFKY